MSECKLMGSPPFHPITPPWAMPIYDLTVLPPLPAALPGESQLPTLTIIAFAGESDILMLLAGIGEGQ